MAIFLLINSVGYTIYAHYCNDELKETSIITKAESCCEEEEAPIKAKDAPMSCCAEKDVLVVIKDQFLKSELSFSAISNAVLYFNNSFTLLLNTIQKPQLVPQSLAYKSDYGPPAAGYNVLYSIFRI